MPQIASQKKANPLWFTGICDELLLKIAIWDQAYWVGEVHSTRQFLERDGRVVDKPTKIAHEMPIREIELDHIIRILEAMRPESQLLGEFQAIKRIWKYGKPVHGYRFMKSYWSRFNLPAGIHRVITVAFYPEHVKEVLNTLLEAKTGQKVATADLLIEKQKESGKELFEE